MLPKLGFEFNPVGPAFGANGSLAEFSAPAFTEHLPGSSEIPPPSPSGIRRVIRASLAMWQKFWGTSEEKRRNEFLAAAQPSFGPSSDLHSPAPRSSPTPPSARPAIPQRSPHARSPTPPAVGTSDGQHTQDSQAEEGQVSASAPRQTVQHMDAKQPFWKKKRRADAHRTTSSSSESHETVPSTSAQEATGTETPSGVGQQRDGTRHSRAWFPFWKKRKETTAPTASQPQVPSSETSTDARQKKITEIPPLLRDYEQVCFARLHNRVAAAPLYLSIFTSIRMWIAHAPPPSIHKHCYPTDQTLGLSICMAGRFIAF